jgi:ABC-type siderophore export system fused ATPase/permease subunit
MNKLEIVKKVAGVVVSIGVGAIVSNAVKANTPESIGTLKKVCMIAGTFVIGSMLSDAAVNYANKAIENIVKEVKEMITDSDLNQTEDRA